MPGFGGVMPGGSGMMPGAGAPMSVWGSPYAGMNPMFLGQLSTVLRAIDACLTMASVILSLIIQALRDEVLQNVPEMRPFTDAFGDYLQALMVSAGAIRRILGGQGTPELLTILREQLEAIPAALQSMMTAWQQLSRQQSVQQSPTMQSLAQALTMAQPLQQQLMAALQPLLPSTGMQPGSNGSNNQR